MGWMYRMKVITSVFFPILSGFVKQPGLGHGSD
ncbi:MAG: hypothetical protein FD175_1031 [Beijerinckiaceae bacterium]|nr:MAG: hypothetical protein FD175_1031 [Beijerinckiaceae bacterium]